MKNEELRKHRHGLQIRASSCPYFYWFKPRIFTCVYPLDFLNFVATIIISLLDER